LIAVEVAGHVISGLQAIIAAGSGAAIGNTGWGALMVERSAQPKPAPWLGTVYGIDWQISGKSLKIAMVRRKRGPPHYGCSDYAFLVGFFFAGPATAVTVLLLPAPALPALFFDMAIAFTSA